MNRKCLLIVPLLLSTLGYAQGEAPDPEVLPTEGDTKDPLDLDDLPPIEGDGSDSANSNLNLGLENAPIEPRTTGSLIEDFDIGLTLSGGFPHPFSGGLEVIYGDVIGLQASLGYASVGALGVDVSIRNWEIGGRWFPWGGAFFIGANYGRQTLLAEYDTHIDFLYSAFSYSIPTSAQLSVASHYWTPHIGWLGRWDSGFALGFEIGYQFPIRANSELKTSLESPQPEAQAAAANSEDYRDLEDKIEKVGETVGKQAVPYVTVLKLGWFF